MISEIQKTVSISYYNGQDKHLIQTGVLFEPYVMTIGNRFLLNVPSMDGIVFHFKSNDNFFDINPSGYKILRSLDLDTAMFETFYMQKHLFSEFGECISCNSQFLLNLVFVIFYFGTPEIIKNPTGPDFYKKINSAKKFHTGEKIIVQYTPLGFQVFYNSVFDGIVSNVMKNPILFITDAKLSEGCSGAPVYRNYGEQIVLSGIILTTMFDEKKNGNSLMLTSLGVSLGVNISVIYKLFRNCKLPSSNLSEIFVSQKSCSIGLKFQPGITNNSFTHGCFEINKKGGIDCIVSIRQGASLSSGIIISEDGLIVTCAHGVQFQTGIEVEVVYKDQVMFIGEVIHSGTDVSFDIAFINIKTQMNKPNDLMFDNRFPVCTLSPVIPQKGEVVYTVGHVAFMNEFIKFMSVGIVSQFESPDVLLTSCLPHNGCSGGAIMRPNGECIGLITKRYTVISPLSFSQDIYCSSIPIHSLYGYIELYKKSRDLNYLVQMKTKLQFESYKARF